MTINILLHVAAVIVFALAAFNVGHPRINMVAAGLALWTAAALL